MVDRIEVDYAQLQQIQKRLQARADELEQDYHALRSKGRDLREVWRGEGADNFFDEMSDLTMPAYRRLIESLDKIYHALNQIAHVMRTAEEQASNLFKGGTATMELRAVAVGGSFSSDTYTRPTRQDYEDGKIYLRNGEEMPEGYKPDVIFMGGIGTDAKAFNEHLDITGGRHTGSNFVAIFNATEKTDGSSSIAFGDLLQSWGDRFQARFGMRPPDNDNVAVAELKKQILLAISEERPLRIEAHSQAGAITSAALMELYRDNSKLDFSQITVNTYGSAGTQFPPGPQYTHYVIVGDPVPMIVKLDSPSFILGGAFGPVYDYLNNREYYANVVVLPPQELNLNGVHGLDSYYKAIDSNLQIPSQNQILDRISDLPSQMINNGVNLYNGLKSLVGGIL